MALLNDAIEYAKRGWFVFPTREKASKPFTNDKGKIVIIPVKAPYLKGGFMGASTDIDKIKEWWTKYPNAGIGISCGHSGLVVVDIDIKDGRDGFRNFMSMNVSDEGALHAITPSGGTHIVYSGNMKSHANIKTGVDIRSQGAYIVAPPSWIMGEDGQRHYYIKVDDWDKTPAPVPPSMESALDKLKGKTTSGSGKKAIINEPLEVTVSRLKQALELVPMEYCNDYFRWVEAGLALKTLGDDGFNLWNEWSKKSPKYDYDACVYRWDKFEPNDIGIGTIFFWAGQGAMEKHNGK